MSYKLTNPEIAFIAFITFICFLITLLISAQLYVHTAYHGHKTVLIKDKERVNDRYIVFTENQEYNVVDSLLYWRWDSSRLYNKLESGKTYKIEYSGVRLFFFSMYPAIHEVILIEEDQEKDLKNKALSKLSDAEKKSLGLTNN